MTGTNAPAAEPAKEAVTFVDAPGAIEGFPALAPVFGDAAAPIGVATNPGAPVELHRPAGGAAEPGDGDDGLSARLSALEADNAALRARQAAEDERRAVAERERLVRAYGDAVALGDATEAARLEKLLTAPPPAAAAAAGGKAPAHAPAGHWSNSVDTEAKAWMDAQPWWGVDGAKTAAVRDMANHIDPVKFPTKEAYFAALTKSVDEKLGRAPAGGGDTPRPRVSGGGERGGTGGGQRSANFTSLSQLTPEAQAAADDMMRAGNLTLEGYLASLNSMPDSYKAGVRRR